MNPVHCPPLRHLHVLHVAVLCMNGKVEPLPLSSVTRMAASSDCLSRVKGKL